MFRMRVMNEIGGVSRGICLIMAVHGVSEVFALHGGGCGFCLFMVSRGVHAPSRRME